MLIKQAKNLAGGFFVLLSGVVLTLNSHIRIDIVATDDDVYFQNGLLATWQNLPPIQMAPLYSAWYRLLHAFSANVIDTYYLSCALLSVLAGLAVYALLGSLRVPVLASTFLSVCFLFSALNFPLQPKVSIFTMLWLMGGLIAANYQTKPIAKLTATAIGSLLAAYGRPEFFLSFMLLSGLGLGYFLWQRRRQAVAWPVGLAGTLVVAGLLVLTLGSPLAGGRSAIAFGQHFAVNYASWHPEIPASPWMHSGTFIKHGFGRNITSLSDAFFLNPTLFLKHVTTNITNLVLTTMHLLTEMLVSPWLSRLVFPGRRYLLLGLAIAFLALVSWPQTGRNLLTGFRRDGWYWLALLIMLAPTFISCILIFPREHYIVFQMLLYLSLVAVGLRSLVFRPFLNVPGAIQYGLAAVALSLFLWPHWQQASQPKPTPIADLLRSLQKIPVEGAVSMTGNEPLMYDLYLGPNWRFWYLERYKPTNMQQFIDQFSINCLHIRPDMVELYKNDPYFVRLLQQPGQFGFVRYPTNKPDQYVLVRSQLTSVASIHPIRKRALLRE